MHAVRRPASGAGARRCSTSATWRSRRALAPAVTTHVSRYRKPFIDNTVGWAGWLGTFSCSVPTYFTLIEELSRSVWPALHDPLRCAVRRPNPNLHSPQPHPPTHPLCKVLAQVVELVLRRPGAGATLRALRQRQDSERCRHFALARHSRIRMPDYTAVSP